jgi:membrane protease YdiL (CAAX protease family)
MNDVSLPATPVSSPHWKLWGTTLWGLLIAGAFVLLQTLTMFGVVLSRYDIQSEAELTQRYFELAMDGYVLAIATFITTVLGCALIAGIVKLKKHSVLRDYLAIRTVPLKTMLVWLGALIALLALADGITLLLGRPIVPEFMTDVYASARPVWVLWIALLVAAPLFEETFFRGFLFRGFETSFLGTVGTVVVTSGFWSLMHVQYDAYGMAIIFCLGLLLGVARARTQSVLVPLGLHSVANLVATIETAVVV